MQAEPHQHTPHRQVETTTWRAACAWCGRTRAGDRWLVVMDARGALITHTICPECFERTQAEAARFSRGGLQAGT